MDKQQAPIPSGISQLKFSKNVQTVTYQILDLPPSCIEFVPPGKVPQESGHSNHYFVVGTYNLERNSQAAANTVAGAENSCVAGDAPKPQERNGSLNLFNIRGDKSLILVERLSYPSAVLDLHFIPGEPLFAVASSTGALSIYTLRPTTQNIGNAPESIGNKSCEQGLGHIATHQIFSTNILILSFIWIPDSGTNNTPPLFAATASTGEVYLVSFSDWDFANFKVLNGDLPVNTHDAEAWCCAFCPSTHCLYSGGDDSQLRVVDIALAALQDPDNAGDLVGGVNTIRGHDAGVTAILPLPYRRDRMFLTGSYDDHIRLYTWHNTSGHPLLKPREIAKLNLGGGVWKLKFLADHSVREGPGRHVKYMVLASCMHIGAKIVELSLVGSEGWRMDVVADVKVHESMCYGCDVLPLGTGMIECQGERREGETETGEVDTREKRLVVSTSFYDKLLFVWTFDPIN